MWYDWSIIFNEIVIFNNISIEAQNCVEFLQTYNCLNIYPGTEGYAGIEL